MRLETLQQIQRRLKPKAPLIIAHHSFPQTEPERTLWISRHLAFSHSPPAQAEAAQAAMKTKLSILAPEEEEALLKQAGFCQISLFYAAFSFKGSGCLCRRIGRQLQHITENSSLHRRGFVFDYPADCYHLEQSTMSLQSVLWLEPDSLAHSAAPHNSSDKLFPARA